jgi:hypothetical protein
MRNYRERLSGINGEGGTEFLRIGAWAKVPEYIERCIATSGKGADFVYQAIIDLEYEFDRTGDDESIFTLTGDLHVVEEVIDAVWSLNGDERIRPIVNEPQFAAFNRGHELAMHVIDLIKGVAYREKFYDIVQSEIGVFQFLDAAQHVRTGGAIIGGGDDLMRAAPQIQLPLTAEAIYIASDVERAVRGLILRNGGFGCKPTKLPFGWNDWRKDLEVKVLHSSALVGGLNTQAAVKGAAECFDAPSHIHTLRLAAIEYGKKFGGIPENAL